MDPRYTDFGEVEFLSSHPTLQSKYEIKVSLILFRLVNSLRPGSSLVGGRE